MKNILILLIIFTFKNVQAQVHIHLLPTMFYVEEVKELENSSIPLKVGMSFDANVRAVSYSEREKKKGNIDTLLCRYKDLLYFDTGDENFDFNLLECVKDSLRYLTLYSFFSKPIGFELSNLEEIAGTMDMKLLSTLLSNSPKFTAGEIMAKGKIEHLEGIEFNSLRWFWLHSEENCFCRNNLQLPAGLLNAPNLEVLTLRHMCKQNNVYGRGRNTLFSDKYFVMPEIKSDTSKIFHLEAVCLDISDPHTLEQIKKLKKLEVLYISFTGTDYSIFDDLKHIKEIHITYPRGIRYKQNRGKWININTETFKEKYPNVKYY